MDEVIETVEIQQGTSLKYQLGKVLFATVVAFAATKLAERSYDAGMSAIKSHEFHVPTIES
jgi:hypothetical protein